MCCRMPSDRDLQNPASLFLSFPLMSCFPFTSVARAHTRHARVCNNEKNREKTSDACLKPAAVAGQEVGGAGPRTQMSEWSLSDARGWLTRYGYGNAIPVVWKLFCIYIYIAFFRRFEAFHGCDVAFWS